MRKPVLIFIFLLHISVISYSQNKIVEHDAKTNKYGIKDKTSNKWLTLPSCDNILEISQNFNNNISEYFIATKNKKTYLISKNGISIISPLFDYIKYLNSNPNLLIVKTKDIYSFYKVGKGILKEFGDFTNYEMIESKEKYLIIKKENLWSLFFVENESIDSTPYDILKRDVIWEDSTFYMYAKKNKWGIIDNTGKQIIPTEFDTLEISDVFYRYYAKTNKNNKWGLLDFSGKTLLENSYENIDMNPHRTFRMEFYENFIIGMREQNFISAKKNGKWGVVDFKQQGKPIIPFIYDSVCGVNLQKKVFLVLKNEKMGIIDFNNNVIYPFVFNGIERIDANFAQETTDKLFLVNNGCTVCMPGFMSGGKYGITDSTGKIILEPIANTIQLFNKPPLNYSSQSDDSVFLGYLWNIGGELIETVVGGDTIVAQDPNTEADTFVAVLIYSYNFKGGKSGIVNRHGKYILPALFDDFIFAFLKIDTNTGEDRGVVLNKITHPSRQTEFKYKIDTSIDIIAVKDKKYGVYNWKGKEILLCAFDSIAFDNFSLDVSDSIFNAKKYLHRFFKVYLNGKIGYYTCDGKKLIDPVIKETLQQFESIKLDSVIKNNEYVSNWNDLFFTQIVCKNEVNKKLLLYSMVQYGEEWSGYENVVNAEDFKYVVKGEFALMDKGKINLLSDEWYDDLNLIDIHYGHHLYTDLKTQLLLYTHNEVDSVFEKDSKMKICNSMRVTGMLQEIRRFFDYYFAKKQGKWFLTSIYNSVIPYYSLGFDSVRYADKNIFQGFLNKKFSYYSYSDKNFTSPEIEMEFPEQAYNSHIVCKDCNYTFIQYTKTDILKRWTEYGDEMPDTIVNYIVKIPFVKKGMFNILTETKELVLKNWADEIRIPVYEPEQNFSITDSSGSIYKSRFYSFNDSWPLYNDYKKSIALKYGLVWRLTTIQNQDIFFDGFDDIKFAGEYWEAKKDGKTFLYTVDGLKLKE